MVWDWCRRISSEINCILSSVMPATINTAAMVGAKTRRRIMVRNGRAILGIVQKKKNEQRLGLNESDGLKMAFCGRTDDLDDIYLADNIAVGIQGNGTMHTRKIPHLKQRLG